MKQAERFLVIIDFKPSGVEISKTKETSGIDQLRQRGKLDACNVSSNQKGAVTMMLKNLGIIPR
jgi:hypothetical protein